MTATSKKIRRVRVEQMRLKGIEPWVDGDKVRVHLQALLDSGLTIPQVARLATVDIGTIHRLKNGAAGRPPTRKMTLRTASRILAVKPCDRNRTAIGRIDATGTQRRLQALVACGWSYKLLAAHLGLRDETLGRLTAGRQVMAPTAAAVTALYERIWDVPPPARDKYELGTVTKVRRMAARRGWVVPAAWDDDQIDNPAARPACGPRRTALPGPEKAAETRERMARGEALSDIATIFGMQPKSLERLLHRYRNAA